MFFCKVILLTMHISVSIRSRELIFGTQLEKLLKFYCSNPKEFWGGTLCSGHFFFFLFSVFSDFEIDDFWHLWYIIKKPLKSSFICTKLPSVNCLEVTRVQSFEKWANYQRNERSSTLISWYQMYIAKRLINLLIYL